MVGPPACHSAGSLPDLEQPEAADGGGALAVALVDVPVLGVLDHDGARPDDAVPGHLHVIADRAVHAQKAALAHLAVAGMTTCEEMKQWSRMVLRWPTWLPLQSTTLLPTRAWYWITLFSKTKQF